MGRLVIPKTYVPEETPLIYLVGPVKSAPDWHDEAILFLFSQEPNLTIVSPNRRTGSNITKYIANGKELHFSRQREWEWHYMDFAARQGCLLFWLPKEYAHHCDKSYALMTSNEFGHWTAVMEMGGKVNMVLGTDGKFREWKTFEYDLQRKVPWLLPHIKKTLEETCAEALKIARDPSCMYSRKP